MNRRARPILTLAILIAAIATLGSVFQQRFPALSGNAIAIDGDSLRVDGIEVRLYGIDAPEQRQTCMRSGQPWLCGLDSERALRNAIAGRNVTCRPREQDRYGRLVAVCESNGIDLSALMVREGLAVAYGAYDAQEREARDARRGLWSSSFENPSAWRARNPRPLS